jgi:excisionase family DNA binding protein
MTPETVTAALVLDGVRTMSQAEREELRALLDLARTPSHDHDGWITSREASAYLGLTLSALHRLTATRAIPFEQDVPGGKCWFRRGDLDTWRRGGSRRPDRLTLV